MHQISAPGVVSAIVAYYQPSSPRSGVVRNQSGNPLAAENEKLRKENERLTNSLRKAEIINDVQKIYHSF